MATQTGPTRPQAQAISLSRESSAVAVLDMSAESESSEAAAFSLLTRVAAFLQRARQHQVPVICTVSLMNKGTPQGEVAPSLKRGQDEPVIYPDGFDKFTGGELDQFLRSRGVENLVLLGRATNIAIMYTATAAARVYKHQVIIPLDGVIASRSYEHEYALHQLSQLPAAVVVPIKFSTLDQIEFR